MFLVGKRWFYVKGLCYFSEESVGSNPTEILGSKEEWGCYVDGGSNSGMLIMKSK